jgi:glycerol-3-phosphate dehydrogenase
LPGAQASPDFARLAQTITLPEWALERIWRRVGSRIEDMFAHAAPADLAPICRAEAVTRAEIAYAVRVEGCRTLEDLRRHAHVGAGGCDGLDCVVPAAQVLAQLLQWPTQRIDEEVGQFMNERWIGRRPVLRGATLAQEEIWRGIHPH